MHSIWATLYYLTILDPATLILYPDPTWWHLALKEWTRFDRMMAMWQKAWVLKTTTITTWLNVHMLVLIWGEIIHFKLSLFQDGQQTNVKIANLTIQLALKDMVARKWGNSSCDIRNFIEGRSCSWGDVQGIGVRLSLSSGLWFRAVVKVEVKTDDRDRVHEMGRIIKRTTNLSFTFITG